MLNINIISIFIYLYNNIYYINIYYFILYIMSNYLENVCYNDTIPFIPPITEGKVIKVS